MLRLQLRQFALILAVAMPASPAFGQAAGNVNSETDPRLAQPLSMADCIAIALENNLEMRIARLERAGSEATVSEAYGAFYPVFGLTAERANLHSYGEFPDLTSHFQNGHAELTQLLPFGTRLLFGFDSFHTTVDPDRTDTPAHGVTFGLTQPLMRGAWWRATTSGIHTARYSATISDANLEGTRLSVVEQVEAAYYEVMRQAKLVEVNQKATERDQQLVEQSQGKLEAGLATKRDVLSAQIVLEQDRGKRVDAQTKLDDAVDALARVLGLTIGTHHLEIADKEVALDSVAVQEDAWIDKAMHDNPKVRAAHAAVDRAQLEMEVAGNGRLPLLDLSVNYTNLDDPDANELLKEQNRIRLIQGNTPKDLKFTASREWRTLLTFSYPLGNRSLSAKYTLARLAHLQSLRLLDDTQRQVTLEVRSAIRALHNSLERLAILQKNIEGARNKFEFASVNFQLGRASNLDVTDAQKDLLNAETDYVNKVIDYRVQVSKIEALLGGSLN